MKVLLTNGSPHKEGCTYTALCEVSEALNENGIDTDLFWIGKKPLSGCIACYSCSKNNKCVFDHTVNEFHHIAGGSITSFLDRVFYADLNGGGNRFLLKPAAAVISARRAGTTATWDQLNKYFGLMQMPIITSRYWNMVHGATPEQVKKDLEGMQVMRVLGNKMAFFLHCKNVAMKMGIELPKQKPMVFTNFIRE